MTYLQKLEYALDCAETALTKSGLPHHVRYADTVANTRGSLRLGSKRMSNEAIELRIMELEAARDYFVKYGPCPKCGRTSFQCACSGETVQNMAKAGLI